MRSAWDFGRVQSSLTSASFAFFNTESFFPFSSLSLYPLYISLFPELAGFPPPSLSALPISLIEQFHGVLCLQIKLGLYSPRREFFDFWSLTIYSRSIKKTSERHGDIQLLNVNLSCWPYFSFSFSLSLSLSLSYSR